MPLVFLFVWVFNQYVETTFWFWGGDIIVVILICSFVENILWQEKNFARIFYYSYISYIYLTYIHISIS